MQAKKFSPAEKEHLKAQMVTMICVRGMKQKEIAKELGISEKTVWKWIGEYGGIQALKNEFRESMRQKKGEFVAVAMFGKIDREFNHIYEPMMQLYKKYQKAI